MYTETQVRELLLERINDRMQKLEQQMKDQPEMAPMLENIIELYNDYINHLQDGEPFPDQTVEFNFMCELDTLKSELGVLGNSDTLTPLS